MADSSSSSTSCGFGIGAVIAAILSWIKWHSIGWMVIHFLFGWMYVLYFLIASGLQGVSDKATL